ncbi:hypothetical protein F5888DRAFT_1147146 [Russula emetica]|nr:hypothetical protein F5888DRAFT_1147146 [Russula emetica]
MFPLPRARSRAPQATTSSVVDLGNSLPNEILGAIFDYLSPDALTRVALVSRRWLANAERVLYSTIILHEVLPPASPSPALAFATTAADDPATKLELKKDFQTTTTRMTTTIMPAVPITTLRCCETLSSHPHLAEYVRRFHLRWETDAVESPLFLIRIAHHIARTLVPTLVHLDSLELSFDLAPHFLQSVPNNNNVPPPQTPLSLDHPLPHTRKHHSTEQHQHQHQLHLLLLPPICLPSLRTLSLRGIGIPPSLELERILQNHPKLLHLRLSDYNRALLHLSPTDVPHLRSFRGYPTTAASILPGRPVQTLGLVGCCELATEEDLARIASGSIPVRALDLSGMNVTPTLLRSVSRHLSHVEWLKVRLALRHTLHYALSGIRLLTALTTVLAAFYNLRGLDLSSTNAVIQPTASASSASDVQQNAAEEQHLCIAWMGACPSLRRVVFPSQTEWLLSEAGTWISGSGSGSRSRSPGSLPRCYLATPTRPVDPVHV